MKSYSKTIFFSLISLVLLVSIIEISLFIFQQPFHERIEASENALANFDSKLGWSYKRSHQVKQRRFDGEIIYSFNKDGIRSLKKDSTYNYQAPTVLFIGCSFTMGHGINFQDTFVHSLNKERYSGLQFVNLGVQAYGTDQIYLSLKNHLEKFKNVRHIIYGYLENHLIRNNNYDRRVLYPHARFLGTKPLFKVNEKGNLYLSKTPKKFKDYSPSRIVSFYKTYISKVRPNYIVTKKLVSAIHDEAKKIGANFSILEFSKYFTEHKGITKIDVTEITKNKNKHKYAIKYDGHPNKLANKYITNTLRKHLINYKTN